MNKPAKTRFFLCFLSALTLFLLVPNVAQTQTESLGAGDADVEEVLASESDVYPSLGTVLGEKVRIRTGPGLENKAVSNLGKGTELWVIDKEDSWYLVATPTDPEKPLGWVSAKWVKLTDKPHPTEAVADAQPDVAVAPVPTATPVAVATPEPTVTPTPVVEAPVNETATAPAAPVAPPVAPNETAAPAPKKHHKKLLSDYNEPPRRKLGKFVGDNKYPIPPVGRGREYLFQVSPGFDSLTDDRGGQFDSEMFRATGLIAIELVRTLFVEAFYSYASYTPDEPTHEIGGGFRLQGRAFWRFTPYIEGGPFYSTLLDDDNLGYRGGIGLPIIVAKRPYNLLIGPYVDYNHVLLGAPGDVEHLVFGITFIFSDIVTD